MITIILPHHLNCNQHLLDGALESVLANDIEMEVLVIYDSEATPKDKFQDSRVKWLPGPANFGPKINFGVKNASPITTGYFICSDDIIIGEGSLTRLAQNAIKHGIVLNATSNCDGYNLVNPEMAREHDGPAIITYTHRPCFYAIMIPKNVWEKVGSFDEQFVNGYEDDDYILRMAKQGIRAGILLNAFIYHFVSQTLKYEKKDPEETPSDPNRHKFWNKWLINVMPPPNTPGIGMLIADGIKFPRLQALAEFYAAGNEDMGQYARNILLSTSTKYARTK